MADKLRGIRAIVDTALSALDPHALLTVLVQRVADVLQADTAAILLLDRPGGQLVAAAASGAEEAVRQDVRIPFGKGYAGQVAAHGRLAIVNEVDPATLASPVMRAEGVRSLLTVPLLAEGRTIGVLQVGSVRPRTFTIQDAELLQVAADRAALVVQALTARLDRAAAEALQHSLVPFQLPAVSGLEMAARYVPGRGTVGGDWYDVFSLPDGKVCTIIGDVSGSGLGAAVVMGRLRSALRAYALETSDPASMLGRLDRKIQYFESGVVATVLCAVFSPSLDQIQLSSAGHPPPVMAEPGQHGVVADVTNDPLIGMYTVKHRHISTLDFPPGAMLCLYTNGLVERRSQVIDCGIAQLCAAVTADGPEAACASVMATMADDSPYTHDAAVLMLHRMRGAPDGTLDPLGQADLTQVSEVRWAGRHAIVSMPGEIDVTNASEVSDLLAAVVSRSPDVITADLTATVYCDSAAVGVFARAYQLARAHGGELRLALGDSPIIRRIFQLAGVDQIVPVYHDVQQSLADPQAGSDSNPGLTAEDT